MFCGYRHLKDDLLRRDSLEEESISIPWRAFLAFARERLIKFGGVSKHQFPLDLEEMEFRYNHRDKNLFEILVKYACNLVPNVL